MGRSCKSGGETYRLTLERDVLIKEKSLFDLRGRFCSLVGRKMEPIIRGANIKRRKEGYLVSELIYLNFYA